MKSESWVEKGALGGVILVKSPHKEGTEEINIPNISLLSPLTMLPQLAIGHKQLEVRRHRGLSIKYRQVNHLRQRPGWRKMEKSSGGKEKIPGNKQIRWYLKTRD